MASFSKRSKERLITAHVDLQKVANEVIKYFDCTVTAGHRTPEEQNKLYQKGRVEEGGIVTYKDGYEKLSKHNHNPSLALDLVPYPELWSSEDKLKELGRLFMAITNMMLERGEIENGIEWGGNWSTFKDYPHYQIK